MLVSVLEPAHRATDPMRQKRDQQILRIDVTLHPEATADVEREAPHLRFRQIEYRSGLAAPALEALTAAGWLAPRALAIVEIAAKEPFSPPAGFAMIDERRYGAAKLVL